jgi:hypothetical protein
MKFSKRVNYLALLFLFVLNIAIRYPSIQHEIGVDSFVMHILSSSIIENGFGKWILHPLSYIGLYPLSYPSAYPFLAAGTSATTGVDVEVSILFLSIILGLIGVFGTYFLAREIKNDDLFCFIVAFAFSFSPIFIKLTFWQGSTRNLFVALAPACMLLLLKTRGFAINRLNILFVILLITVGTSHRLGVFMIFILIAYLTGVLVYAIYKQFVPIISKSRRAQRLSRFASPMLLSGTFALLFLMLLTNNNPLQGAQGLGVYEETSILVGSAPHILLLNLFVSLIGRIGFMLVFGVLGIAYLIWKKNKALYEVFLIISLIFIFPTIGMRTYSSYFFLVFFSLFAGIFFYYFFQNLKKRKIIAFAILLVGVFASIWFYAFMFDHWSVSEGSMTETEYDTAIYMRYQTSDSFITNDGLIASRCGAISEKPCIPIGGATLHANGPQQLIYDFLHEDDFQIIPIPLQQITVGSNALYQAKGAGNVEVDWAVFHGTDADDIPRNLIVRYNLEYSISRKRWENGYWAYGRVYYSRLLTSLELERYRIYDNGDLEIHYLEKV